MPTTPDDPRDFGALEAQELRRLRALERRLLDLAAEGIGPLQTFEDGAPLGDTRFLDFGAGLQATLIGDDFVRVTGAGAGGSVWDALVDSLAVADDPNASPPTFTTPGKALTHCAVTLGLTRANIYIRPGAYTETANWTSPTNAFLFGTSPNWKVESIIWTPGAFTSSGAGNTTMMNMTLTVSGVSGLNLFGTNFTAINCGFHFPGTGTTYTLCTDTVHMVGCRIEGMRPLGGTTAGTYVLLDDTDINMKGQLITLASRTAIQSCRCHGSGSDQWTVGAFCYLDLTRGEGTGNNVSLAGADSAGTNELYVHSDGIVSTVSLTGTRWETVQLWGNFGSVTIPFCDAGFVYKGTAIGTNIDVTGPGLLDSLGDRLRIRGRGVNGSHVTTRSGGSGGTAVEFLAANHANISVSIGVLPGAGTTQSYNFDASSADNLLLWNDHAEYPVAGTNSGTNNRILPEGSVPSGGAGPANADYLVGTTNADLSAEIVVGTTPGGELGGTWASPTVDATHSGSAHTDFIAKALVDAKGDVITATADNTPVRKAVGADGTALVASAAAGDGLVWGTPAVLNFAAATTLGTVVGKVEIFDGTGASLGFLPVYDAIT